jgi:hypothetical protein
MITDSLIPQPIQTIVKRPVDTIVSTPVQEVMPTVQPFFDFSETVKIGTFERTSIFGNHLLKPVHLGELPIPDSFNGWFFALLFFGFVLYAWLISFNIKRMGQLSNALFGTRGFNRLSKEGNVFSEQLFFPLMLLIVLCFSLFVFRVGMLFDLWDARESETILIVGYVLLGTGMLYLGKVVFIKVIAWIFKEQTASQHYLLNLFAFNTSLALLLLPLLLVVFFGNSWIQTNILYLMIFLFAVWFIWRAIRSFLVTISITKFSYVHNFLYLCTLEIGYYLLAYVILKLFLTL